MNKREWKEKIELVRITARDAHGLSGACSNEAYYKALVETYSRIHDLVEEGETGTLFVLTDLEIADQLCTELTRQGYNTELSHEEAGWHLQVDWKDVDLDPESKYVLPLDETVVDSIFDVHQQAYAVKSDIGWQIAYAVYSDAREGLTVTAKDIEEAPDWVKAIEPIAVKRKEYSDEEKYFEPRTSEDFE